jgi:hypothetical protein
VKIRTNMTSSAWFDLGDAIAAKDGTVIDDNGAEIPGREVLRLLEELPRTRKRRLSGGWWRSERTT